MKYMNIDCNVNCWECNKRCDYKVLLKSSIYLPSLENAVYFEIMENLKAQAYLLTLKGISKQELDEEIKVLSVSFYVARLKLKEQLIPESEN